MQLLLVTTWFDRTLVYNFAFKLLLWLSESSDDRQNGEDMGCCTAVLIKNVTLVLKTKLLPKFSLTILIII